MQGNEGGGFFTWLDAGGWWQILCGAGSMVSGSIVGAWVARGTLDGLKQKNIVQDLRLDSLERDREVIREMASNLAVLAAIQDEMKDDIKSIFGRLNYRSDDQPHGPERRHNGEQHHSAG